MAAGNAIRRRHGSSGNVVSSTDESVVYSLTLSVFVCRTWITM